MIRRLIDICSSSAPVSFWQEREVGWKSGYIHILAIDYVRKRVLIKYMKYFSLDDNECEYKLIELKDLPETAKILKFV